MALFVALPFFGFWLGAQFGAATSLLLLPAQPVSPPTSGAGAAVWPGAAYYSDVAAWQTDQRMDAGFSIAYPLDFSVDDRYGAGAAQTTTDWRFSANGVPGSIRLIITIPAALEPQTNFRDARLTVGDSAAPAAVASCLTPDIPAGPGAKSATTTINGVPFSVFTFGDAGAGNLYQVTSYRTIHAGRCYAVEYAIHSAQIGNYPAEYGLRPFDQAFVADILDRMARTFRFE